jgi:hypothetical protein
MQTAEIICCLIPTDGDALAKTHTQDTYAGGANTKVEGEDGTGINSSEINN